MADENRERVDATALTGVPATMMWTLRNRAVEASSPGGTLVDPLAVRLYETLDYPYENFGKPSQSHALRARAFDDEIRAFLADHPGGTVVALGEGLQTSYWRIGDPDVRWVSIDLPEVVALRRKLLPEEPNVTTLTVSALDRSWMDHVDTGRGVFVSAEGLLMYLPADESLSLIGDCARRFPGGRMMFDSIPKWLSRKTQKGLRIHGDYTVPPMPFHLSAGDAADLPGQVPDLAFTREVTLPLGRGLWGSTLLRRLSDLRPLRNSRPTLTLCGFAG
ncbi:class I SAM-dependent methyltransferase [Rhodococcus sp. NM-2]|uniref:class I SAM-dependent methyltransferase n=1 Tax=Rhodococcus TaxID=1827 RepID=UPI002473D18E|nr:MULTISPECIES: class I SAM-dependent methyltransferase [Rhodococcus]MDH6285921.1 O-methyltransferase involved in polyketide biosynthesis [Rhodococcus opacus]MDI9977479.1 class I SAM-dependent methyltransferase [Rhodococcus sp. IEGM 1307]